jgi:hypothetical protein
VREVREASLLEGARGVERVTERFQIEVVVLIVREDANKSTQRQDPVPSSIIHTSSVLYSLECQKSCPLLPCQGVDAENAWLLDTP